MDFLFNGFQHETLLPAQLIFHLNTFNYLTVIKKKQNQQKTRKLTNDFDAQNLNCLKRFRFCASRGIIISGLIDF